MSAFENRDYADGYRDGTRFAEVTITALRAEVERLTVEARFISISVLPEKDAEYAALRAENERLRAALREIIEDSFSVYAIEVARAALEGRT